MQIHELNTFSGTPSSTDYLAIDNSTTTTKIGATGLGVQDKLTVAEANTGTSTASRIVTPKVVHDYVVQDTTHITSATKTKWSGITGGDGSINDALNYQADHVNPNTYKSGDTYTISNPYLFGAAGSAGTVFFCSAFTPKSIPDDLTITWSGSFTQVHNTSGTTKQNIPIDNVLKYGDNIIIIQGTSSGLGSKALLNCVLNATITFN